MSVERFWCHEARNIRCVRESDYNALAQQLAASEAVIQRLHDKLDEEANSRIKTFFELAARDKRLAEADVLLRRIADGPSCGCLPCTGDCTSKLSLEIMLDEIRDEARAFLSPAEDKANG